MHKVYKTEGIILRRVNIGEADRLITIFSKHTGKITVIAKGVRRITSRRASHLELFNHAAFVVNRGKRLDYVSAAEILTPFETLRTNFNAIGYAYAIVELLDRLLAEHQENSAIYLKTLEFLSILNKPLLPGDIASVLYEFKLLLLDQLGFSSKDEPHDQSLIDGVIEQIIERRLHSRRIFAQLQSPAA